MDRKLIFDEKEIPFDELEENFGLSSAMIEDLPVKVLENFYAGRPSPALPLVYDDGKGAKMRAHARLRLIRNASGRVEIMFIPKLTHSQKKDLVLTDSQKARLEAGKPIVCDVTDDYGNTEKRFVQIDTDVRQVVSMPFTAVMANMQKFNEDYNLSTEEQLCLTSNCEDLTVLSDEGEQKTIGIDLCFPTGIRTCDGGHDEWEADRLPRMPKYTFGLEGCWVKTDEGYLDFYREDEYTPEIQEEWEKVKEENEKKQIKY